jgi:hypothetical protein
MLTTPILNEVYRVIKKNDHLNNKKTLIISYLIFKGFKSSL